MQFYHLKNIDISISYHDKRKIIRPITKLISLTVIISGLTTDFLIQVTFL